MYCLTIGKVRTKISQRIQLSHPFRRSNGRSVLHGPFAKGLRMSGTLLQHSEGFSSGQSQRDSFAVCESQSIPWPGAVLKEGSFCEELAEGRLTRSYLFEALYTASACSLLI